jgi:hypothetical protein
VVDLLQPQLKQPFVLPDRSLSAYGEDILYRVIDQVNNTTTADMTKAVYDPGGIEDDCFDMDNMQDGTNKVAMTTAERTKLSGISAGAEVNTIDSGDNISLLVNDAGYLTSVSTDSTISGDGTGGSPLGVFEFSYMKRTSTSTQSVTSTPAAIPLQTLVDSAGSEVTWDGANNTRLTSASDGTYRIGAYVTVTTATGARAQTACEVYINGVAEGDQRGASYIRNAGAAYDWWVMEISTEPFELSASDYVELYVGQVNGNAYGYAGALTINLDGQYTRVWLERVR